MDEELLKAIEAEGWSVRPSIQDGKHIVDIAVFSPAGEDFCPTIGMAMVLHKSLLKNSGNT